MAKQKLVEKLQNRSAVIGVVGLGYVGLPLCLSFIEAGFADVIGLDIDQSKIDAIARKESYIKHIGAERVSKAVERGFMATTDYSVAAKCDALILCVPTPLNRYREPDLSYILDTLHALLPHIRAGQVMSLESTTYPGTTEEELLPKIEERGFKVGHDYFLIFSPEREDPGNPKFHTRNIPKVVGGHTKNCLEVGKNLYLGAIDKIVEVSSTKTAEMTKLLENIHRAVNIGLVNEMKIIAEKMGIDIYEVIDAAATKPFGFTPYYPGPGLGGHCIPIDPFYLTWKAREYDMHTRFIELAGEVNRAMPDYVMARLALGLNKQRKSIHGSKVLVIGIAYKKNVDDCRESPSVMLMEKLREMGAEIVYHDPYFPHFPKMREHKFDLSSVELTKENIEAADVVLISTDHDSVDYIALLKHAKLVVDCRGRYRGQKHENLVLA